LNNYWEADGVTDSSFEEVEDEVVNYLMMIEDLEDEHEEFFDPNISFAPLCDNRWELVAFDPSTQGCCSAIIDSVYCTPEVARRIVEEYPEVEIMQLREH
jgi:hypothetical protein